MNFLFNPNEDSTITSITFKTIIQFTQTHPQADSQTITICPPISIQNPPPPSKEQTAEVKKAPQKPH
jgi:hypothetical protein